MAKVRITKKQREIENRLNWLYDYCGTIALAADNARLNILMLKSELRGTKTILEDMDEYDRLVQVLVNLKNPKLKIKE